MPSACATLRASATACGPQHLSSAREMQSCGQTFIVTPTTSYPCSRNKYPATLESTPPLIPSRTRCFLPLIGTTNFDQAALQSMNCSRFTVRSVVRRPQGDGYSFTARLTNGLPRKVNRHGKCAERLIPIRLSATTSKVARELETKQRRGSEHRSISW